MTKKYSSVEKMLDSISDDTHLRDELESYSGEREMARFLSVTRCANGLSQELVAQQLGCTQGCVSKLESSVDADLRFGEVDDYLRVLGLKASMLISQKNATALDDIKYHVNSIKSRLEEMAEFSQPDDGSAESVASTHFETLINVVNVVVQSAEKITFKESGRRPFCRLELGFIPEDQVEMLSRDDIAASP